MIRGGVSSGSKTYGWTSTAELAMGTVLGVAPIPTSQIWLAICREVPDPRTFRGQPPGQSDQLSRGDGNREWKGKGRGKENDSSQQFKTGRSKASHSQGTTPSYSKANKHSQSARVERSKGGSQTSGASYSKANKHSQSARVERSRGGSQNSGASYSTPNKSQSAGATGKGSGGGGHKSGKKGSSNKGDKGKG